MEQDGFDVDNAVYPLEAVNKNIDTAKNPHIASLRAIQAKNDPLRKQLFDSFYDTFITRISFVSHKDFAAIDSSPYDYVVVGSDQVWNRKLVASDEALRFCFLAFAEPDKRVNYAPSIGMRALDESYYALYKEGLDGFRVLSCREISGCEIIRQLTGKHAELVLDPTLLLTAEQWRKIARKPSYDLPEHYALFYTFGVFPDENITGMIHDVTGGLPLINIRDVTRPEYFCTGPCEFVYLIDHADYVFTNSFHGTAFAVNFSKKFVSVVGNNHEWFSSYGERIESLLSTLDIMNDVFYGLGREKPTLAVNYDLVHEKLGLMREKSMNYLRKCLCRKNL